MPYPKRCNCLPDVNQESGFQRDEEKMQPLSALLTNGPFPYERFLNLAIPLVEAVGKLHSAGSAHGRLDITSVMLNDAGQVSLSAPSPGSATFDEDLKALGRILYHVLTGKPLADAPDVSLLKRIYPIEAKLTVEKLLGLHSSGQFVSIAELHASLVLMKDVFEISDRNQLVDHRTGSARVYLILSLIALILVLVWIVISINNR